MTQCELRFVEATLKDQAISAAYDGKMLFEKRVVLGPVLP